jgi:hypothetical protein
MRRYLQLLTLALCLTRADSRMGLLSLGLTWVSEQQQLGAGEYNNVTSCCLVDVTPILCFQILLLNPFWPPPPHLLQGSDRCFGLVTTEQTPPSHSPPPPHKVPSEPPNCSQSVSNRLTLFLACVISSTLKMEAKCYSETSVYNKSTRCHIPEDCILR